MSQVTTNLAGGVTFVAPYGELDNFTFANTFLGPGTNDYGLWVSGDTWSINMSTSSGDFTLGKGNIAGIQMTCCFTLSDRMYIGGGNLITFSALSDVTGWEQQDVGAGFIGLMSQYGAQDGVLAMASYQGKLAVYGRRSVQIWNLNADPLQFSRSQTLTNTGTVASLSVQGLGDNDILALGDNGVWSVRVRDASNNAYTVDIGNAIQALLKDKFIQCDADDVAAVRTVGTTRAAACAVVDPTSNRYWLFLRDTIYVFSYFETLGILAWSTYLPTDSTGATFVPSKFVVYQGQVYARGTYANGTEGLIQYGGSNNNTYDATKARFEMPWLHNEQPATNKQATGVDALFDGMWTVKGSMDYLTSPVKFATITTSNKPTTQGPMFPYTATGTHFKLAAETTDVAHATSDGKSHPPSFSSFIFHYEEAGS